MSEEPNNEFIDDRDDKKTIYGLPDQNKLRFNSSIVWIPVAIGLCVAAGVLTTRGIQRLTRGVSAKPSTNVSSQRPQTMAKATSNTAAAEAEVHCIYLLYIFLEFSHYMLYRLALHLNCRLMQRQIIQRGHLQDFCHIVEISRNLWMFRKQR